MANIFRRIFGDKKKSSAVNDIYNDFIEKYNDLINQNKFISRKEYKNALNQYFNELNTISSYEANNVLKEYCSKNNLNHNTVLIALDVYKNLEENIKLHNSNFINDKLIEEKEYLDNILKVDDPKIVLDDEQRRVILNDEDYCLVVAGAGAGKTTTIAAKVKYLVDK